MAAAPDDDSQVPKRRKKMPLRRVPTATEEDMQEFVGVLASIRNGNETEIPALLASKVEFLLSRDTAELMKRLDAQCANDDERGELNSLFNIVIDFVEQFVSNTAMMSDANGQLLREIFESAAAGMQALDAKMKSMLSGQDPRYTPEFIRFLDAEILRLRGEVAKQVLLVHSFCLSKMIVLMLTPWPKSQCDLLHPSINSYHTHTRHRQTIRNPRKRAASCQRRVGVSI